MTETFYQRGARLLRECRMELSALKADEARAAHPICPLCGRDCHKFTGRHSGQTFVAHPFAGVFEPCRLSDRTLPVAEFERISEI